MRVVKTENSCGHMLCHDVTQIIKDVKKDVAFKKGHIVTKEDIPVLLSMGKDTLYIWEKNEGTLHEDEACEILYNICADEKMSATSVKEGKIDILAKEKGLLKIDVERVKALNSLGEIILATVHNNMTVEVGQKIAGTRIIPLTIEAEKIEKAIMIGNKKPLLTIKNFKQKRYGIITTGNEIFHNRIKDTFTPVIVEKLLAYGGKMISHVIVDDNLDKITKEILDMKEFGCEAIFLTGGMSVDPDDVTPSAIKNSGADIISYGAPVLPGAMFMLAYLDNVPIVGLPGCCMYNKKTIFDLILPRLVADDIITRDEIISMGVGGLCLACDSCTFPKCGFGRGYI